MTRFCSSSPGPTARCGLRSTTRRGSSRCWWTRRRTRRPAGGRRCCLACPLNGDSARRPRARPCTSRSHPRAILTRATIATRRAIVTLTAAVTRRAAVTPRAIADRWLASRPAACASGTRTCPVGLDPPADPRDMKYLDVFRGSYPLFPADPADPAGHVQRTRPSPAAAVTWRDWVIPARSTWCDGAQGRLAGDVYTRMHVEFLQDVGGVGRDGPAGQEELGGDLWAGQSRLHQGGDLDLARREAVPATPRLPVFRARPAADAMSAEPGL